MKTLQEIKQIALNAINDELSAIEGLRKFVNDDFAFSVDTILKSSGRVIVTGIGKSANIAQKIVSTFNSTGTQSMFMHAADAVHGDLGMIRNDDILICISKSGNTPEIKVLLPSLKLLGNKLIAIVGNPESYLAQQADFVINTEVEREACPNNLAPTSSTTAQLVMGDALAVTLLESRGFTASDFGKYHPGGALGKKLFLRVSDIYPQNEKPQVASTDSLQKVIVEISSKRLGATAVVDNNRLIGIITDGDLRRMLETHTAIHEITAADILTRNPKSISFDALVADALVLMRNTNITQLPVMQNDNYVGIIHLHDILKEGII